MSQYKKVRWERFYDRKGRDSEETVANILSLFRFRGTIATFKRTKRNSIEDRKGVDFWIYKVEEGVKVRGMPLQVKSSWQAKEKHAHHSKVPCLSVSEDKFEKRLSRMIQRYFQE